MGIKFSVLIATLNRPEILKTCVKCLLNQTYDNYEIIIIDQSDKEYRDDSVAETDSRINYIHIDEKGLSHARNVGLHYVTGNYVCLIDDDALYDKNYLKESSEIIKKIEPIVLVGMLIDPVTKKSASNLNDCKISWKNVIKGLRSACMIIETNFLKTVKFDEKFGIGSVYGSGEETDILMNALYCNKAIYFTRAIKMYHIDPSIEEIPLNKIASYAFGAGALFRKTVKNYSFFWGVYYLLRTVIGNFLLWMLQSIKRNYVIAKARKFRAVYTLKGFLSYRINS